MKTKKYQKAAVIALISILLTACGNKDAADMTTEVHDDYSSIVWEDNQSNVRSGFGYQCGDQDTTEVYTDETEPSVVKVYEVTDPDTAFKNDELVTMVKYYEMSDGTWKTDTHAYQYRLEITGRMGGAVKDSTFVFLSNTEDITFDQAWKAAGFSSNMNDYFKEDVARFVALK